MSNKEPFEKKILQTASVMMCMTLISKLFGFIREMVFAGSFGTSYVVDAYVLAQSIPNVLLGGILLAISTAYTPGYSQVRENQGKEAGDRFTGKILNLTLLLALGSFVIGVLLSNQITTVFAKSFSPEAKELTSFFLKATFGCLIFSCSINTINAYLQYDNRFYSPIIGGYLYNVGIIAVAIFSANTNARFLGFAPLIGYGMNLVLICWFVYKSGYHHRAELSLDMEVQQTLKLALPVFLSASIYNLNTFVDKTLAASLREGSISALNYGYLLTTLITGLTSTIIVTILYPKLTQAINANDTAGYEIMAQKTSAILLIIGIPFSLGAMAFSEQMVQIVYERGAFDDGSTLFTADAFLFYGLGIAFIGINELLTRVFYSQQDMKTPVFCAAGSILANILLNLLLIGRMEHKGLALATSVAAMVNTVAMTACLRKKHPHLKVYPSAGKLLRILLAAILAVGVAVGIYQLLLHVWMPRIVYLMLAVMAAVIVYLILLALFRIEEVEMLKELRNKN